MYIVSPACPWPLVHTEIGTVTEPSYPKSSRASGDDDTGSGEGTPTQSHVSMVDSDALYEPSGSGFPSQTFSAARDDPSYM